MKSFSESAARGWSKDHVREVLETVKRDLEDNQSDLSQESRDSVREILKEKIDDLREERDFLTELLNK